LHLKQRACHSYAGVATHYVPSERLEQLEDRLSDMESSDHEVINMVIEEYSTLTDTKQIGFEQEMRQIIDRYVYKRLPSPFGKRCIYDLSPYSLLFQMIDVFDMTQLRLFWKRWIVKDQCRSPEKPKRRCFTIPQLAYVSS
jgi:hypothetical protein